MFGFYLPDHPKACALNMNARENQYALWPNRKPLQASTVLFIHSVNDPNYTELCGNGFSSFSLWDKALLRQGKNMESSWGVFTGVMR
jgi:hypothetical protein